MSQEDNQTNKSNSSVRGSSTASFDRSEVYHDAPVPQTCHLRLGRGKAPIQRLVSAQPRTHAEDRDYSYIGSICFGHGDNEAHRRRLSHHLRDQRQFRWLTDDAAEPSVLSDVLQLL